MLNHYLKSRSARSLCVMISTMNPAQQVKKYTYIALFLGSGSLTILMLVTVSLLYGISDGSFLYAALVMISPFLSIASIIYGILALRQKGHLSRAAVARIIVSWMCVMIYVGLLAYIFAVMSGLQGVY